MWITASKVSVDTLVHTRYRAKESSTWKNNNNIIINGEKKKHKIYGYCWTRKNVCRLISSGELQWASEAEETAEINVQNNKTNNCV